MRLIFLYIVVVINCVVSEVTFGRAGTLLSISEEFPSRYPTIIISIQENSLEPNTLFISTNTSIFLARLLPEEQYQLELIAGNVHENGYQEGEGAQARFHRIGASVQTEEGLIVADGLNHCLRLIQPLSEQPAKWRTSTYAGGCLFTGSRDGSFLNARFYFPFGMVKQNETLFVSEIGNKQLRKLDMANGVITTIHSSHNYKLFGLVSGNMRNEFFVGADFGILRIREQKESWLVGWSKNGTQNNKAPFSTALFSGVLAIAWLGDDILLVTDRVTRTVKVVNLAKQEVDVICPSESIFPVEGDIKSCVLYFPHSMFVTNNTIFIGQADGAIRSLQYQISDVETSTTRKKTSTTSNGLESCKSPTSVNHSLYEPLESYPEGSTVYYQCTDNYVRRTGSNNKQVCAYVNGQLLWIGTEIECLSSSQMVTASVLAAICICTVIAIVVTAVKIRSINKRLEEATVRQTQINSDSIGSGMGCSNQSFSSRVRRGNYSSYSDFTQHISTSSHFNSSAMSQNSRVPKPAPRLTRQTGVS